MNNTEQFIEKIISGLTIEEKVGMVHGNALFHTKEVDRLNIPQIVMSDGPTGIRYDFYDDKWVLIDQNYDYITYIPSNSAVASTWNPECARNSGRVLGEEARGRGKDVILAPGINIKRSPLCGRNFEYFSEDPKLIEEMVAPMVSGIQEYDVASCVKHFAANNQETDRMAVDTIVDERTLREIYLPGFVSAIKRGNAYSMMGAYNKLNGQFCCTSSKLIDDILRKEWGYDGAVISDWGGVHDTDEAVNTSLDIEMDIQYEFDEHYLANPLLAKIKSGEYPEDIIDNKVRNILNMMLRLKMIGEDADNRLAGTYNNIEHREMVKGVAEESIVLLKNEDNRLPLNKAKIKTVAVIGENGKKVHSNGGGSAEIKALYEICPLMGIMKELGGNTKVYYADGYYVTEEAEKTEENWQAQSAMKQEKEENDINSEILKKRAGLREEAIKLAKMCDEVIFVGGLNHTIDCEGKDKDELTLPYGQDELIEALLKVRPDMIIVMHAGSPVAMTWADKAKAILWAYYAGMEGGTSIAEVLFGKINPSGHLPETFLKDINDCKPISDGQFGLEGSVEYTEGIMVGYRQYDSDNTDVLYPFGYGLSYTTFDYSNLEIQVVENEEDVDVNVTFDIENTGSIAGATVAQLYVRDVKASVNRPYHELKDFSKEYLEAGEKRKVTMTLNKEAFDFYSVEEGKFVLEAGAFVIEIGQSSRDILLEKEIHISKNYIRDTF